MPDMTSPKCAFRDRIWKIRGQTLPLGETPWLMGILNVTPDSFSDGGQFTQLDLAVAQGLKLIADGARILDIGGESTRPGAEPVTEEVELQRVVPVVERLAEATNVLISVDTTKAVVARAALKAGAHIVNDISGLQFDVSMPEVCAESQAGVICMHIQGTPQTMQQSPHYEDVVGEILQFLEMQTETLCQKGIARESIVLDPGIGFGKTAEHNLQILGAIGRFQATGRPICIGHSRKRFLGKILGRPLDERTFGTVGVSVALAAQGTDIIRLHDVAASRDAILSWQAVEAARLAAT